MTRIPVVFLSAFLLAGCQSLYYGTMEKFGVQKRDILVDRVEAARDAQQDGQEEFKDALEQFRSVVEIDGGELEDKYDALQAEYDDSKEAAEDIHERVDAVENVAEDLFEEWADELDQYSSGELRRDSQRKLRETRDRYSDLITTMRAAESRLDPVLEAMEDQVLYLKHNLNARAIEGLRGEVVAIDRDVDELLAAMAQSIKEADAFIRDMRAEG
ncbi:DUF2959 domain-containing protein [Proteobacteria bacterium 005FR1]|nr:DUF2959 domain-containing protein [Proteobacteria bacterium 005FR1]